MLLKKKRCLSLLLKTEISSDDSDRENSNEGNSDKENYNEEN